MKAAKFFCSIVAVPLAFTLRIHNVLRPDSLGELPSEVIESLSSCDILLSNNPQLDYRKHQTWGAQEVADFDQLLGHLYKLVMKAISHPELVSAPHRRRRMPLSISSPTLYYMGRAIMHLLDMNSYRSNTATLLSLRKISCTSEEIALRFGAARDRFIALQHSFMRVLELNSILADSFDAERNLLEHRFNALSAQPPSRL